MRIKAIIKWIIIIAITIIIFKLGQAAAFETRGYKAAGGEYMLLLLPFLWYIGEQCIKDTLKIMKQEDEDGSAENG